MRKLLPALATIFILAALSAPTLAQKDKEEKQGKRAADSRQSGGNQTRTPNQPVGRNQPAKPQPPAQVTIEPPRPGEQDGTRTPDDSGKPKAPTATDPNNTAAQTAAASSLSDPIILGITAMLILAGFALHGLHFMNTNRIRNDFGQINQNIYALRKHMEEISGQVLELKLARNQPSKTPVQESPDNLQNNFNRLEERIRETRSHLAETSQAIATLANWAGESTIERALASSQDESSDAERAQAARIIERHLDAISANAARLQPLAQEMLAFEERIKQRTGLPVEFLSRMRSLTQEILQFEEWKTQAGNHVASLRRGSVSERRATFIEGKNQLAGSLNTGAISATDYVKGCRRLTRELFSEPTGGKQIPVAGLEDKLASLAAGACDLLMDWYDDLFKLHSQVAASQSSIGLETVEELARIRRMAKEALLRFDIQPEEIQPGRTSYDSRLHGEAIVTQSSQFPINTVISVQQCGFRRPSNAEVLRRPKVVVAGVGAG